MAVDEAQFGSNATPGDLQVPRAQGVAQHLLEGRARYGRLVGLFRNTVGVETVVVELDVEVPQAPTHSIQPVELIALQFSPEDRGVPAVLALRRDFPQTPHQNLTPEDYPKSLCLYDQPWSVLKLRWTPASFIERIREWLALTSRGELHGSDQPLEPILLSWESRLVLPAGALREVKEGEFVRLYVDAVSDMPDGGVLVARGLDQVGSNPQSAKFVATLVRCNPQEHGVIRKTPKTLDDLHKLTLAAGLDLKGRLQQVVKGWREHRDIHEAGFIILVSLPKTRAAGAEVEARDLWAFGLHTPIRELARVLNVWEVKGKHVVPMLGELQPVGSCEKVAVSLLNPQWTLTKASAARSNGLPGPVDDRFVAIGAGALGSQVLTNLARCGFGSWTLIDEDVLLPHNLARHALNGFAIGVPKAIALSNQMHSICGPENGPSAIVADVLDPRARVKEVDLAVAGASCLVDFSASVPVARALARSMRSEERIISLFLNPSGTDLVLLAEDRARKIRLDHLEHQLYRALLGTPALAGHFAESATRVRYAQSCRDLSSTLPQHLAALHGAIGSKALRDAYSQAGASIKVWRADNDLNVTSVSVAPSHTIEQTIGNWTVVADDHFTQKIRELRQLDLPNETGGVLIGSFDLERRIVYLVDTIPSPPDSKKWPTLYIRGAAGLAKQVVDLSQRTSAMLQYVGEWHSHPPGVPPLPSEDDCTVFAWLTELMDRDGFPAIMLIAGDHDQFIYVCRMSKGRSPL